MSIWFEYYIPHNAKYAQIDIYQRVDVCFDMLDKLLEKN